MSERAPNRGERKDFMRWLDQKLVENIEEQYEEEEAFINAVEKAKQLVAKLCVVDRPAYKARCKAVLKCVEKAMELYIESDPLQFEDAVRDQINHIQTCYGCGKCIPWYGR